VPQIEFRSKEAADQFRDEWQEHLCSDDDRRLKTVTVVSDAPEHVIEQAHVQGGSTGQPDDDQQDAVELSPEAAAATRTAINAAEMDGETTPERRDALVEEIGLRTPRDAPTVPADLVEEVRNYVRYYEEILSESEDEATLHDPNAEDEYLSWTRQALDELGASEDTEEASSRQCNHARGHCERGDEAACEFLQDQCGFDDQEIEEILSDDEGDFPGRVYRALQQLWTSYRAGLADAKQAAAAINEIRQQYGQEPLEMEELGDRAITKEELDT
jgi:hypothetical protein